MYMFSITKIFKINRNNENIKRSAEIKKEGIISPQKKEKRNGKEKYELYSFL